MIARLLWNDVKHHKLLTITTIFFMAASSMFLALAAVLFTGLLGSVDGLMEQARTPDYLQMHAGEIDPEKIALFAEEHTEIEKWQICPFLNLENSSLFLGNNSLADSTQDNGLCVQGEGFDYLLDMNNTCPVVSEGEVYVPACYRSMYDLNIGDRMQIGGEVLEIAALSEKEKANLRLHRMGFVFQNMNMMENLDILDNILLPALQANKERKGGRKTKNELVEEAMHLMNKLSIAGLEHRNITEVSGGQLQRACICGSMINHPQILFADEPTGALNRSAAEEMIETLLSLNREGTTVLMVTHDSRVASCCSRILYLLDGQIQGELSLEGCTHENIRQREERVNRWLTTMEW